jgi:hypothetical protein
MSLPSVLTPRNLLIIVLSGGVYVLAYRHGQLSAPRPACECGVGRSMPGGRAAVRRREEEELLDSMPETERRMVSCMLERAETRGIVRRRLHTCLHVRGVLDPVSAAQLLPPPSSLSPPPPMLLSSSGAAAGAQSAIAAGGSAGPLTSVFAPPPSPPPPPLDPLLELLRAAHEAEDELPSAPLQGRQGAPPGSEAAARTLALAASAAKTARLVLVTCINNGRQLTLDPASGWAQCAGRVGSSASDLLDALFAQETIQPSMQLAFKHVRTGKYLQIVPPSEPQDAWVVRAHATAVGPSEVWEVHSGRGGHTFLYHLQSKAHLNHRFGFIVRGHGDSPGRPAGRVPSARLSMQYMTHSQLKAQHADATLRAHQSREPIRQQMARIHSLPSSQEVRVISYGLYGKSTRYTIGVLRNAQLAPLVYPGWKVRVYLDRSVPRDVVAHLERLGAQIVQMGDESGMKGGIAGMFWRFLVAADPAVDRFIIRDSDSRLNTREALAVAEWVQSGKLVHSIRDHPNHDRPLNGGMWGGTKNAVPDMAQLIKHWSNRDAYMGDLDFLNQMVWTKPSVRASQMSHDAYSCHKYPNAKPFPTPRPPDFQHVGQVFFGDGRPRQDDITSFMLNRQAPRQCRGDPAWVHG